MNATKSPAGYGAKGKLPAAKSSDGGGERSGSIKNGVGMGMKDSIGSDKRFNTGKTEGTCYTHGRKSKQ